MADMSIVEIFREDQHGSRCGYCKSPDGSYSYGMWGHKLTVQDYQNLIDRGWRRSGKYCYKPTMQTSCCALYPIKCKVMEFIPNKSHKKVLKKIKRFLVSGERTDQKTPESMDCDLNGRSVDNEGIDAELVQQKADMAEINIDKTVVNVTNDKELSFCNVTQSVTDGYQPQPLSSLVQHQTPGGSCETARPLCKKAKQIRFERKLQRIESRMNQHMNTKYTDITEALLHKPSTKNTAKSLEDFLALPGNLAHNLEIRLIRSNPQSSEFIRSHEESYAIYKKYQMTIHKDPLSKCTLTQYERFLVSSPLEINLVRSCPASDEFLATFQESFNVYQQYQMAVHKERPRQCDQETFEEFLVKSPLLPSYSHDAPPSGYGSFHQQYLLDGHIIAVGVIDILPSCVSSVYFYYDPDYSFLSLGTFASLREIAFTRELNKYNPHINAYYLGFYIHTCPKMKYKGQYRPSFLLCPETYSWHAIEKCRPKLDQHRYSRLEDNQEQGDEDGKINLADVMVLYRQTPMTYSEYINIKGNNSDSSHVEYYAKLVGKKCACRILVYRG